MANRQRILSGICVARRATAAVWIRTRRFRAASREESSDDDEAQAPDRARQHFQETIALLSSSRNAACQYLAELRRVDIATRDNARDLAPTGPSGQSRGDRRCACPFRHDVIAFDQEADRPRHLLQ